MHIFEEIVRLNEFVLQSKKNKKSIGFVPTMGALHLGHVSLINEARKKCDIVICSIFVNPTQFNDKNDLQRYPRTLTADLNLLGINGCDVAFVPTEGEIYPENLEKKVFEFEQLEKVLEGSKRPGHFNGVAQVVSRLFEIVQPDFAFFGQKDFQQCMIVQSLVKQLKLPVEIVVCPIIREQDGLAMSSRNTLLTREERVAAALIPHCMNKLKQLYSEKMHLAIIKSNIEEEIAKNPLMKLDYLEICLPQTLEPIIDLNTHKNPKEPLIALIAVFVGKIRLIDNIIL